MDNSQISRVPYSFQRKHSLLYVLSLIFQRMREHRAKKELEHALKVELVKKMRSERQCKSSKELISCLHQERPGSTEKGRSTKLPKLSANNKTRKKTPKVGCLPIKYLKLVPSTQFSYNG